MRGKSSSDPKRLAMVRAQPCIYCGALPPSEAHHVTWPRGLGQRSTDAHAVPLCHACHMSFHDGAGPFRDLDHEGRTTLQAGWLAATQRNLDDETIF